MNNAVYGEVKRKKAWQIELMYAIRNEKFYSKWISIPG